MASLWYSLTTCPDQLNPSWQITQRIWMVCQSYNGRQIWLRPGVFTCGIIGRPLPLLALPRLGIVRPLQRLDGVSLNLCANLTQSLTAAFSHRRYIGTRAIEASLPLRVVYCVVTEANLSIMSYRHDTYPSRHYAGCCLSFILTDLNFTEFYV
jgi:hypothetical protein